MHRTPFGLRALPLILFAGFLSLPVLAVLASWLPFSPTGAADAQAGTILREMVATVLPNYVGTTLWLSVMVALGAAIVGTGTAAAVTLFEFPGRRVFEWLLLLPLAMPAYVTAYAYTDFLQFSGPLQVGLRNTFGLEGRLLPEVRSLGGRCGCSSFRSTLMCTCWRARPWVSALHTSWKRPACWGRRCRDASAPWPCRWRALQWQRAWRWC